MHNKNGDNRKEANLKKNSLLSWKWFRIDQFRYIKIQP